jgi:hypothetical protein
MKKSLSRVAVVATIAATLVGGFGAAAQAVGTTTTQANGSYGPVRAFLAGSYVADAATAFAWSDNVIASASTTDIASALSCPVGSESAAVFLSARGSESTKSSWKAFAGAAFVGGTTTVSQANLKPAGLTSGTPGAGAVKSAGGDYSLGVACLSNSGVTVDRAYFRHISVTATSGAWTAAATDYVYATPTITVTRLQSNIDHVNPSYAALHTGDTLNAAVGSNIADGFDVSYQWYSNGSIVSGATASNYTTVTNDAGKAFTVVATYAKLGFASVSKTSSATNAVEGDAVVSGDITVSASVLDATNGQLALSIPNNASASLSSASLVNNFSTSTGVLGEITINDGRVVTRDGWNLRVSATDFTKSNNNSVKIGKEWLGFTPFLVSSPSNGNVAAGTASVAGSTSYPYTLASQAALGNTQAENTVGQTIVNANLKLVAPQYKASGTYTATVTVTVYSN